MAQATRIEWTESTWNPVTGCTKVSPGCQNCYAERLAHRLQAMGNPRYRDGFAVTLHEDLLETPLSWRRPRMIFVNSMSDLFHEDVPLGFIRRVFRTMNRAHWHTFQVLTKRPDHLLRVSELVEWTENIWMGVTIENAAHLERAEMLRNVPAKVRFVSAEPLLTDLPGFPTPGIDWVIVGGESGPGARPISPRWVGGIRDRCLDAGVPFFFKQWGGPNKKKAGRVIEGRVWDQIPMGSLAQGGIAIAR